jgi:hypothetical protein
MIDYEYYEDLYEPQDNKQYTVNRLKDLSRYCDCRDCRGYIQDTKSWKKYRKKQYREKKEKVTKSSNNAQHWKRKRNISRWFLRYDGLPYEEWLYYYRLSAKEKRIKNFEEMLKEQLETFWIRYYNKTRYKTIQVAHALDGQAYIDGYWYTARELVELGFAPHIYRYKGIYEYRSLTAVK